jgi:4-methyl-5(b-hydroxyethyl)-thiazole monophosphate biosynthesis
MSKKRILVLLAPGFEELEAVAVIDILRRAGLDVVSAGTISGPIISARNVAILPDKLLDEVTEEAFDLIVLPGGLDGTENLAKDQRVIKMLQKQLGSGRAIGAICAAPTVLDRYDLAQGKTITCHPTCRDAIQKARFSEDRVVRDGLLVTSQGPGTAIEFALNLVELLMGKDKMLDVNIGVLARIN